MRVMTLDPADYLLAIRNHTAGLAAAATGNLDASVAGCPGWSVRDVVLHLIEVHRFWATITAGLLQAPPDPSAAPAAPSSDALIATLLEGCDHLVKVLQAADWKAPVWTWAPSQRDVGFIGRHQVQEAAIHHWDVATARGEKLELEPAIAADSIEEFLTVSVSNEIDPADPVRPSLGGCFALACSDRDGAWTVTDGPLPGTVRVTRTADPDCPTLRATASDLLLWLYKRVDLDPGEVPPPLAGRFRDLCFTD